MNQYQPILNYILCIACGLGVGLFSIPNIIFVAKRKRLLDVPDNNRKLHARIVPNLGGVGIFFAYIIVTSLFINPSTFEKWNYIAAACLILFITGLKDDLVSISPSKKFIAQFAASFITAYLADVRISSLQGLLGIYELPYWISIAFTVVGCMFVTNAYNLIDGVDGLAGSVGLISCLFFGITFALAGHSSEAIVAFSMMGAIAGFLRFNIAPARIFMGDTGSLLIGFVLAILGVLFVKTFQTGPVGNTSMLILSGSGALLIALAILFMPIFDTFRVFSRRILQGHSPFRADRTHFHHYLLDLGMNHNQTVITIVVANVFIVLMSLVIQRFNINLGVFILCLMAVALFVTVAMARKAKERARALPPANPKLNGLEGNLQLNVNGVKIVVENQREKMAELQD